MNLPEVKRNIRRVIAGLSAIALVLLAGCDFQVIKVEEKESGISETDITSGLIPAPLETTVPPPLDLPETEVLPPHKNTPGYDTAVNNAFESDELSEIIPKAEAELPEVDISASLDNKTETNIPKEVKQLILDLISNEIYLKQLIDYSSNNLI